MAYSEISPFPDKRSAPYIVRQAPRSTGTKDLIEDLGPMQEAADLPDLFAALAQSIVGTLRADACLISIYDEKRQVLRDVAASVTREAKLNSVAEEYSLEDFPLTKSIFLDGGSVEISTSDPTADAAARELLGSRGFSRLLICQLAVDDGPIGTIEAYRTEDRPFRSGDSGQVQLLTTFAANAYSRIQLAAKLEIHYMETLEALASALEAKDPYTQAHTGRIRDMAVALGVAMQIPSADRKAVRLGAILHDVGKIGITDHILQKPGSLTPEEWNIMRTHPEIGEHMLKGIEFLAPALPVIRHHHEWWDGKGYPDKLAGEQIPIGARIVGVCDSFDAMTTKRPYKKARSVQVACEELLACAGTQFDPTCAALLVDVVSRMGEEHLEERFIRYAS